MTVLYKEKFINTEICQQLNKWVEEGLQKNWLGDGLDLEKGWTSKVRKTTRNYADRFNYPQIVYDVSALITKFFNLEHLKKSVAGGGKDGIVVSCTYPEGDVHSHTDPLEQFGHVLRCNILTQKADKGGELYLKNKKINLEVGDLHCYLASDIEHKVTKVDGQTSRILWMFGYQITKQEFNELSKKYVANNSLYYRQ
jgi:hypothetical protein